MKHSRFGEGVAGFSLVMALVGCAGMEHMQTGRSLYDRLGGKSVLSVAVEQFVINVVSDTRINGRFATTDIRRLKVSLVDQVCMVAGGPCTYSGRDMKTIHTGMNVSHGDYEAFMEDLARAFDTVRVPPREKRELLQLLGAMKKDIVEYPPKP